MSTFTAVLHVDNTSTADVVITALALCVHPTRKEAKMFLFLLIFFCLFVVYQSLNQEFVGIALEGEYTDVYPGTKCNSVPCFIKLCYFWCSLCVSELYVCLWLWLCLSARAWLQFMCAFCKRSIYGPIIVAEGCLVDTGLHKQTFADLLIIEFRDGQQIEEWSSILTLLMWH